jgi:hypothetical protein
MASAYQNLLLEQGTTYSITIVLDDIYGNNYNVAGFFAYSTMSKSYYSSNSTASFDTIVDTGNSTVTLSMSANTTANISPGRYVYDTILKDNFNSVVRVLEGIVEVSPSVTRR